jgi:hypothetical protein
VRTASHIAKKGKIGGKHQTSMAKCFQSTSKKLDEQETFNEDLCRALVSANIPLSKLANVNFSSFLKKYCKLNVPSDRSLRRNNVNGLYSSVLINIKEEIADNYFYISVDETTDSSGKYIAHLLIGVLKEDTLPKSHLISCQQLEKTNALTISRFIQETLATFFLPTTIPSNKLLLILSDAAPYMVKAGQNLKIFFPDLIHVTCVAHGLNRVAEEIRKKFPLVNTMISSVKKVFLKSPIRIQLYKEMLPNIPLPPQPILTRWGTWLEAANFYADHFVKIKNIIDTLTDESSQSLLDSKQTFQSNLLQQELSFIKSNFSFVQKTITQLESPKLSLFESTALIKEFASCCRNVRGNIGKDILKKFEATMEKNKGYHILSEVVSVLAGNISETINLEPNVLVSLKNAPVTSVDVERSFSIYKYMYSDRSHKFLLENFEHHLVIYCYHNSK